MTTTLHGVERKPIVDGKQDEFKDRLLDRVNFTVPRKILTAGGFMLDGTTEGLL